MPRKISDLDPFEGKEFLLRVQQEGIKIYGGTTDGLVAIVLGLVNHLVKTGVLKDE